MICEFVLKERYIVVLMNIIVNVVNWIIFVVDFYNGLDDLSDYDYDDDDDDDDIDLDEEKYLYLYYDRF